jgi:hypothetical protein
MININVLPPDEKPKLPETLEDQLNKQEFSPSKLYIHKALNVLQP